MKTLQMTCAPSLIEELPRMFGGMESILKELFQNSFRCGTTTLVEIEWDPDTHVLVFRDNGTGIAGPQALVTAGSTGWDEQHVIDPAGLGVFSLLNDQICGQVEIISRSKDSHWRMFLSPDSLRTKAAQYEDLALAKNTGLELTITLLPGVAVRKDMVEVARALYPYMVIWKSGNEKPVELLPIDHIKSAINLETEVGQIMWQPRARGVSSHQVVWEFCPIESLVFSNALLKAADNHCFTRLALAIAGGHCQWHIDPASKVRPRLPDRSELIDDSNLEKAASAILDALVNEVTILFNDASDSWPSLIKPRMFRSDLSETLGDNDWLVSGSLTEPLMEMGGWKIVEAEDPGNLVLWHVEDYGFESTGDNIVLYDKNALEMSDPSVVYTLVNRGVNIAYDKKAGTEVKLHGLKIGSKVPRTRWEIKNNAAARRVSPLVVLVDRIEVCGYGDIPFLIRESDYPWAPTEALGLEIPEWDRTVIVFAGCAPEFIAALQDVPLLCDAISLFAYNTDILNEWNWWLYSESRVDHGRIVDDLVKQITEAHEHELFIASGNYYAFRDASLDLFGAIHQIKKAVRRLIATKYWNTKILLVLLTLLQRAASKLNDRLGKERDKLARKAGLK